MAINVACGGPLLCHCHESAFKCAWLLTDVDKAADKYDALFSSESDSTIQFLGRIMLQLCSNDSVKFNSSS